MNRSHFYYGRQQNQCQFVEKEKDTNSPMSFKQIALLEARTAFRKAKCPDSRRNGPSSTRRQASAESISAKISGTSGTSSNSVSKTHLPSPCRQAPIVGKRAPGHVHCKLDCGSESVPKHDQRPSLGSIRAVDFGTSGPACARSAHFKSPTEFHVTSSAPQQICAPSPKGKALLARQWRQKRDDQQSDAQR